MEYGKLDREQQIQEEEYAFPYHYLDLFPGLEYTNRVWQSLRAQIRRLIGPCTGQRILDAGCGDARLCYDMRDENAHLTGVDYSERAVCWARGFNPQAEIIQGDLLTYRPDQPFDVIVLSEVLEHFRPDLASEVLASLHRCLADGGRLIITVPSTCVPVTAKHYQHFDVDRLQAVLDPHFRIAEAHGHVRACWRSLAFKLLTIGPYFLRRVGRAPMFRIHFWLAERILQSIERCPPEKGERLIAVCVKSRL